MRVGNSTNTNNIDNLSNQQTTDRTQTTQSTVDNVFQSAPTRPGSNPSSLMRQAEASIGASMKASQLRGTDNIGLGDIFKNVLDWILGRNKPKPQPQPPANATNLQVVGDANFRARVASDLNKFAPGTTVDANGYVREATNKTAGHDQGYALISSLLNNPNKVTIQFTANNAFTSSGTGATGTPTRPGRGSTATVAYDPSLNIALPTLQKDGTIKDEGISSEVVLAHELVHAAHAQKGTIDRTNVTRTFTDGDKKFSETWRFEEFRTTGFTGFRQGSEPTENSIRAELGYQPRATYLDRSGWRAVNGISENVAATAAKAGSTDGVTGSWKPGDNCVMICCFAPATTNA